MHPSSVQCHVPFGGDAEYCFVVPFEKHDHDYRSFLELKVYANALFFNRRPLAKDIFQKMVLKMNLTKNLPVLVRENKNVYL
jgi:hypothetical protein